MARKMSKRSLSLNPSVLTDDELLAERERLLRAERSAPFNKGRRGFGRLRRLIEAEIEERSTSR